MYIDYTATRELYGSGQDELEFDIQTGKRKPIEDATESASMSKVNRETQFNSLEHKWLIRTVPQLRANSGVADLPRFREFAASVAGGETFTFDVWGTEASPDNAITGSYIKGSYDEVRVGPNHYQFAFEILER
jgi:hypothetical protein